MNEEITASGFKQPVRILVVEDEFDILEWLSNFLSILGYDHATASDGAEALEHLTKDHFSIVLTDIVMPRMNGMELLSLVRREYPQTDVIVMTGVVEDYSYPEVIEAGAIDYIAKPFHLNELKAKLARVIREQNLVASLKSARDELELRVENRTRDLEKTHEQLLHAEKLSAIGRLSASIAHEFNNPLFGIQSVLEGLEKNNALNAQERELIALALSECQRVKKLILNLRDFNRPTSKKKQEVDVHALLNDIIMLINKEYKKSRISLDRRYAENLPPISVVPDQIKQVFLNLLTNAKDVMEATGGRVTVATEYFDGKIGIRFSDSGPGINPDILSHIFEPFYT
ncbi:MAG: response regulator, partial [Deltaproteobacteria bacterium]